MRACYAVVLGSALGLLHAQTITKPVRVTVTVKDSTGAVIPKADVALAEVSRDVATRSQVVTRNVTSAEGEASFDLAQGQYELIVTAVGFSQLHRPIEVSGPTSQGVMAVLNVSMCGPCLDVTPNEPVALERSEALTQLIPAAALPQLTLSPRSSRRSRTNRAD